jgi:hypothetical protein
MAEPLRAAKAFDPDGLPRIAARAAPAPGDFATLIAAGLPVVLKGLFDRWPALAEGKAFPARLNAYLKGLDRGAPAPVMEAPARAEGRFAYAADLREFSFTKRSASVPETLDRMARLIGSPQAPTVAIQMLPLASHMPEFVRQNPMPLLPAVGPKLWIGGRVRTQTHNDRDHNLACVISGRRRFILFPPEQVPNLYVGPLENPPPLSLVDPDAPDLARFPLYAEAFAHARLAMLEPGDAIFVPRYWWHHVTSLDPYNAMVNYWWGEPQTDSPNDAFLTALLAFKQLPEGERRYWQAMFETHVFADDGAAHLPEMLQGALGRMSPAARAKLRQQLKKSP